MILGKSKIKIYKHDNVVERPGNTMSTILLDVISESIQICDSSFCVDSLNHMYFRAVAFPLIAFLPENNSSTKTMVTLTFCCSDIELQTHGKFQDRQNIIELSKSHMVQYCVRMDKI